MTRRMLLLALVSVLMLIVAACDETTPERVADDQSDDAPAAIDEPEDEPDDDAHDLAEEEETDQVEATDDANGEEAAEEVAESNEEDAEATDDNDATEPEGDDAELEEAEGFTVGDRVRMGDLVMTLHSVRWDEGSEFMGPDEGMRWLVADVEIENEADSSTNISSLLMFDLVDQENRTRDLSIFADTEGSLNGELGPGRSMRGDLAWEVREEQTEWELIFSPQLFGFGQAIFDITIDDF